MNGPKKIMMPRFATRRVPYTKVDPPPFQIAQPQKENRQASLSQLFNQGRVKGFHGGFVDVELLSELMPDDAWAGRRVFVVGSGPSLKGFDFSRLNGEIVIVANKAYLDYDASIHFSLDQRFMFWVYGNAFAADAMERFSNQRATPVFLRQSQDRGGGGWKYAECSMGHEVTRKLSEGLMHCSNSGLGSMLLACALGASEIYLLGFDMLPDRDGNQQWYHGGYGSREKQRGSVYKDRMIPEITLCAPMFKAHGCRVVNLNRESGVKCFEFGDFDDLPKGPERPIVVGYYTDGNGYEKEIVKMERSVHRFGLDCYTESIPVTDWQSATQYKAKFLLDIAKSSPDKLILYLDADAEMIRYPEFIDNFSGDFAVPYIDWSEYGRSDMKELVSSAILFRSNKNVIALLEDWVKACAERSQIWDQKVLQLLVNECLSGQTEKTRQGVKVERLPDAYCHIDGSMGDESKAVIRQHQASRRLKGGILEVK